MLRMHAPSLCLRCNTHHARRGVAPVVYCLLPADSDAPDPVFESSAELPAASAEPSAASAECSAASLEGSAGRVLGGDCNSNDDQGMQSDPESAGEPGGLWHADVYLALDDVLQLRNSAAGRQVLQRVRAGMPQCEHQSVCIRMEGQSLSELVSDVHELLGAEHPADPLEHVGLAYDYEQYCSLAYAKAAGQRRGPPRKRYSKLHRRNRRKRRVEARRDMHEYFQQQAGGDDEQLVAEMHHFGDMPGSGAAPHTRGVRIFVAGATLHTLKLWPCKAHRSRSNVPFAYDAASVSCNQHPSCAMAVL